MRLNKIFAIFIIVSTIIFLNVVKYSVSAEPQISYKANIEINNMQSEEVKEIYFYGDEWWFVYSLKDDNVKILEASRGQIERIKVLKKQNDEDREILEYYSHLKINTEKNKIKISIADDAFSKDSIFKSNISKWVIKFDDSRIESLDIVYDTTEDGYEFESNIKYDLKNKNIEGDAITFYRNKNQQLESKYLSEIKKYKDINTILEVIIVIIIILCIILTIIIIRKRKEK